MQQIKTFFNLIDILLGTFWSMTVIEIVPLLTSGTTLVFTQVDNIIKILFSLAGLVYLIFRIINYYHMSKLNREIKRLEIYKLNNEKFFVDFNKEFLNDKK